MFLTEEDLQGLMLLWRAPLAMQASATGDYQTLLRLRAKKGTDSQGRLRERLERQMADERRGRVQKAR
jgi:hypothetical protein